MECEAKVQTGGQRTDLPEIDAAEMRIGLPLNLIVWILASLLIPVIWPF